RWVLDVSRAMRLVTQSLFPPFRIMTQPVAENTATQRRLMAGYLVHHEDASLASVLYCELRAHCQETASLVFYENELCKGPVMEICITEHSICCEKVGVNCSCFCIEDLPASAQRLRAPGSGGRHRGRIVAWAVGQRSKTHENRAMGGTTL
ncbi:unnamed protein product, partial [Prorocentrum cordatum]